MLPAQGFSTSRPLTRHVLWLLPFQEPCDSITLLTENELVITLRHGVQLAGPLDSADRESSTIGDVFGSDRAEAECCGVSVADESHGWRTSLYIR
jgi:hypothetical protein